MRIPQGRCSLVSRFFCLALRALPVKGRVKIIPCPLVKLGEGHGGNRPWREAHSLGCRFETGSCSVAQAGLELRILLIRPPECWYYRCETPRPAKRLWSAFPTTCDDSNCYRHGKTRICEW
jgi:hypothetical protein